ncbi:MAG: lipopolysaccharide transport periplasmic protein LptA [Desulfuromonadales bacterium GWD2_61_12]|nr:MAG: lipopolysaccharide transport periplasmic protein LptA [Desulfuromonadales bacterium GWC2_61_20]OGR36869.1 MAG: lipopolysaccharide transport periplasmic protein LptA [Desulfuromonadales bacterium GWD2_61_12]HAD03403.1 lipopolysaccharide transport periplasmic protein LptA [Desulfuromonas sp.]HBT82265.1 lipopolysaccharide transport periplasmic protein LptA [Desulfuromonas sp.]
MIRATLLLTFLFILAAVPVLAAPEGAVSNPLTGLYSSDQPVGIVSDRLEADDVSHQVHFVGNVVVRQGNFTLYAQAVTVRYLDGQRDIDQVEAIGGVRILQGNRVATGERATLFNRESRIVLSGAAKVHQGQDFIQGDEITVFLNEDRSVVSGPQGTRVNAVIHPKKDQP